MKKKMWIKIGVVLAIVSCLFFVSCAKKPAPVEPEPEIVQEEVIDTSADQDAEELARQEELAREEALREEELRLQKERELAQQKEMFINEDIHFDYNDSTIRPDAQEILKRKAMWMQENTDATIVIEGHCDERGSAEYNLALGDRRAESVKTFLTDMGIDASRMSTISYGEEMPIDQGNNEAAWAKNRRAHLTID